MTALTLPTFGIRDWIDLLTRRAHHPGRPDKEAPHDETRNRLEFVQEMLTTNSDAFASDLDVQSMMQLYPGRF